MNSIASCISARGRGNGCSHCSAIPEITFALNIVYNFWFMAMWMFWVWFAWQEKPGVNRTRTFLSFMLIWAIGGSLLAIAFSSAGPCFFSRLGLAPDPYAPLMSLSARGQYHLSHLGDRHAGCAVERLCQWRSFAGHLGHAQHA